MLDVHYATGKPLPGDRPTLHRLLRARTLREKGAVETIVEQFWTRNDAGLINKRARNEIERASAQAESARRVSEQREARKRQQTPKKETTNRSTNRSTNAARIVQRNDHYARASHSQIPDKDSTPPSTHTVPLGTRSAHAGHAACGRVCVPEKLHSEFTRQAPPDFDVRAWYGDIDDEWTANKKPIGDDPFTFWRKRWREKFGGTASNSDRPREPNMDSGWRPQVWKCLACSTVQEEDREKPWECAKCGVDRDAEVGGRGLTQGG